MRTEVVVPEFVAPQGVDPEKWARQMVLNAGLRPDDARFGVALAMIKDGEPCWRVAEWSGQPRDICLALGAPPNGVET